MENDKGDLFKFSVGVDFLASRSIDGDNENKALKRILISITDKFLFADFLIPALLLQ